jgi:hypothetical protein
MRATPFNSIGYSDIPKSQARDTALNSDDDGEAKERESFFGECDAMLRCE